mgnify:FL=1
MNLKKLFKNGIHPEASYYMIEDNKITISKNNNFDNQDEISFKGEVLLDGDAIKGEFFSKGEQTIPSRVYYNLDKALPNPLIREDDEDPTF